MALTASMQLTVAELQADPTRVWRTGGRMRFVVPELGEFASVLTGNPTITSAQILAGAQQAQINLSAQAAAGRAPALAPTAVAGTGGIPVSLAMDVAGQQVQAGIFGTIGRIGSGIIKGFASGGPIGAVVGGVSAGFGGGTPTPTSLPTGPIVGPGQQFVAGPQQRFPQVPTVFGPRSVGIPVGPQVLVGGAAAAGPAGTRPACPSGMRPNKTSYWTAAGFVPKETKCVKVRRRNSLNPSALSRAIGRVEGAKRASKRLGRITIRKACK